MSITTIKTIKTITFDLLDVTTKKIVVSISSETLSTVVNFVNQELKRINYDDKVRVSEGNDGQTIIVNCLKSEFVGILKATSFNVKLDNSTPLLDVKYD